MKILYEDSDILVVKKPAGIESQSSRGLEADMVSMIKNYLYRSQRQGKEPYVGVIHRLDKPVGGILVYAKTPKAAKDLSSQIQEGKMEKKYMAVVCGKPEQEQGNYIDYLLKDGKTNTSRIVPEKTQGAKRAELFYEIIKQGQKNEMDLFLISILLKTGRHHQIRVQFAGHGTPLFGDRKYGGEGRELALFACQYLFFILRVDKKWYFMKNQREKVLIFLT